MELIPKYLIPAGPIKPQQRIENGIVYDERPRLSMRQMFPDFSRSRVENLGNGEYRYTDTNGKSYILTGYSDKLDEAKKVVDNRSTYDKIKLWGSRANKYTNANWLEGLQNAYEFMLPGTAFKVAAGALATVAGAPALQWAGRTLAPGSQFWMHPATKVILGGAAGGAGVDAASQFTTGNTWSENVGNSVEQLTGWNPNSTWWGLALTGATNPGYYMSSPVSTTVGKVGNFLEKNLGFKNGWIRVGNTEYSPDPNSLNSIFGSWRSRKVGPTVSGQTTQTIDPKRLSNRELFSVKEYGSEPIYTRETAPTRVRINKNDITESHMNDGTPGSEVTDANKLANNWFSEAPHGLVVSYESDYALSSDSYPLSLLKMHRWEKQGLGQFVETESAPQWIRLNKLGNKSFEELLLAIDRVNKLTGKNYKIEKRLSPILGKNNQPVLHPITGLPLQATGIYIKPVSFFKYKKGNKICTKIMNND